MIFIYIRATLDWQDEAAFQAQLRPAFRPKVERWNATFTMPFHLFRHQVREIARASLGAVEGATCAAWDEIPDGAVFIPFDDDDWLAPDVARALEAGLTPPLEGCYWTGVQLEVPIDFRHRLRLLQRRILPWTPPAWTCFSSNYALVKQDGCRRLLGHTAASRWVDGEGAARFCRIERALSVQNRNLGSQTSLAFRKPTISRRALIRKYHAYRRLYDRPVDPAVAWSRPYVARMAELMDQLRLKD